MIDRLKSELIAYNKVFYDKDVRIRNKIDERDKQVKRLNKKLQKHHNKRKSWVDIYLRPLAEHVILELNKDIEHEYGFRYVISGSFGLGSRYLLEFKHDELNLQASIIIVPLSVIDGIIHYETGETTDEYAPGTIGYANGFNSVTAPIESVDQIVKHIQKHYVTKRKRTSDI